MGRQDQQRGFTLMELMITVAVIGILAKIALPSFFGQSRKSKAKSEVGAIFSELAVREEQYKLEQGSYLSAPACPATPSAAGQSPSACLATGQPFYNLRVRIQESSIYCSYAITAGSGAGTNNPAGFTFTSPTGAWYYLLATCDMDNSSTTNSTYFMSSMDATMQKLNEGY